MRPIVAPPKPVSDGRLKVKQFPFVENPATVLLIPVHLVGDTRWWSYDGVLLGGIQVGSDTANDNRKDSVDATKPQVSTESSVVATVAATHGVSPSKWNSFWPLKKKAPIVEKAPMVSAPPPKAGLSDAQESKIRYLPSPIPRSWGEQDFHVIVEYESSHATTEFSMKLYYGCGDPSELRLAESPPIKGISGGKQRMKFRLNKANIARNELFRATLDIIRATPDPVYVYGVWLEIGV